MTQKKISLPNQHLLPYEVILREWTSYNCTSSAAKVTLEVRDFVSLFSFFVVCLEKVNYNDNCLNGSFFVLCHFQRCELFVLVWTIITQSLQKAGFTLLSLSTGDRHLFFHGRCEVRPKTHISSVQASTHCKPSRSLLALEKSAYRLVRRLIWCRQTDIDGTKWE